MSAIHFTRWEPLWKRKKVSRTIWRQTHGKNVVVKPSKKKS